MFSRTSEIPKSPMTTGTIPMPSLSSVTPKVNRRRPLIVSVPTMPSTKPSVAIIKALRIGPLREIDHDRDPKTISEKYSGGPNLSANRASGGARSQQEHADGPADKGAEGGYAQRRRRPDPASPSGSRRGR